MSHPTTHLINPRYPVHYLKRLASNELEKLLTAFKRADRKIEDLILELEEKKELVEDQEEQLKPEIYLSRKEQADREMNDRFIRFLDKAWRLFTGQPKWPLNFIGIIFGTVIGLLFIFAFYGIIVFPIFWLFGWLP